MGEGDEDTAGQVLADLDGDFIRAGAGRDDIESVDPDRLADRLEHIGTGTSRKGHENTCQLDRFRMGDFRDLFIEEDERQNRARREVGVGLEAQLWVGEGTAQEGRNSRIGKLERSIQV